MTLDQLPLFRQWLEQPHVRRWFLQDSTIEAELADCEAAIRGVEPTHVLIAWLDQKPVGWTQWYCWDDDSLIAAADYGADPGDVGIDYCIGDPGRINHGWGTRLIEVLIDHIETLLGARSVVVAAPVSGQPCLVPDTREEWFHPQAFGHRRLRTQRQSARRLSPESLHVDDLLEIYADPQAWRDDPSQAGAAEERAR